MICVCESVVNALLLSNRVGCPVSMSTILRLSKRGGTRGRRGGGATLTSKWIINL